MNELLGLCPSTNSLYYVPIRVKDEGSIVWLSILRSQARASVAYAADAQGSSVKSIHRVS